MFEPIIHLDIHDHDYEIKFNYLPPEPQEWDHPGAPEEIEITSVKKDGRIRGIETVAYLMDNHYDKIKEAIETKIKNYNQMMEESEYE